jgi:trans-2-enoyl-CoA reductase
MLTDIARQAALIACAIESNQFTAKERDFFIDGLKRMMSTFVEALVQMIAITIKKLWNALVEAVWSTLNTIARAALPVPSL